MNDDTEKDYIICLGLLVASASSGLVTLITGLLCLLASTIVYGFRSVLLSVLLLGCCQRGTLGATLTTHPLAGTKPSRVVLGPTGALTWDT
jgi:hypothetical protein